MVLAYFITLPYRIPHNKAFSMVLWYFLQCFFYCRLHNLYSFCCSCKEVISLAGSSIYLFIYISHTRVANGTGWSFALFLDRNQP